MDERVSFPGGRQQPGGPRGSCQRADFSLRVVEMDSKGYILTGRDVLRSGRAPHRWSLEREPYFLETSMPGVFAAGDARCRSLKRVASAVGEGATAIQLVHEYLRAG